jgi:hypothetical protein
MPFSSNWQFRPAWNSGGITSWSWPFFGYRRPQSTQIIMRHLLCAQEYWLLLLNFSAATEARDFRDLLSLLYLSYLPQEGGQPKLAQVHESWQGGRMAIAQGRAFHKQSRLTSKQLSPAVF